MSGENQFIKETGYETDGIYNEQAYLVKQGDEVEITEGKLPSSYYYTIEPAVAMSGNYSTPDRLKSRHGVVKEVGETSRGYYVLAEFED